MFMKNKIKRKKGRLDDIFIHHISNLLKLSTELVFLMKTKSGMLIKAIKKWNIDIKKSFFIGDSISDLNTSKKIDLNFFYKTNESLLKQVRNIIL